MKKSYGTVVTADSSKDLDHITRSLHELEKQSDRAAAIVGAAIVDVVLLGAAQLVGRAGRRPTPARRRISASPTPSCLSSASRATRRLPAAPP
jgi:hypothetical protein